MIRCGRRINDVLLGDVNYKQITGRYFPIKLEPNYFILLLIGQRCIYDTKVNGITFIRSNAGRLQHFKSLSVQLFPRIVGL